MQFRQTLTLWTLASWLPGERPLLEMTYCKHSNDAAEYALKKKVLLTAMHWRKYSLHDMYPVTELLLSVLFDWHVQCSTVLQCMTSHLLFADYNLVPVNSGFTLVYSVLYLCKWSCINYTVWHASCAHLSLATSRKLTDGHSYSSSTQADEAWA